MTPDPPTEIVRRLRCAAGHLNAVIAMAEHGQSCEKILHQLNAVEAALHAAGGRLVTLHIRASEAVILADPSPAHRSIELKRLLSLYASMNHKSKQPYEVTE